MTNESPPERIVTITGRRQNVQLDDIIRVHGARRPEFRSAQTEFRQAWIILHRKGRPPSSRDIAKVDAARSDWEAFFRRQTLGRASVSTDVR
jgi:hypothetical protein